MAEAILNPTPDQTFRIEGRGDYDFSRTLRLSDEAQRRGAVDEACNLRFHAFQHLADLIPDNEEVILEWEHPNTQAALHLLYRSAVDHFLIDDFELSAAMLEFLLDLDPEDHEEATWLLAFDYVALADYDAFDEVINDVSDKYPEKPLLTLWSEYRRHGSLPAGEAIRLRNHFAPYYKEFTADSHPADDAYLRDIESERPTPQAQARELWLKTENLWTAFPGFIAALKAPPRSSPKRSLLPCAKPGEAVAADRFVRILRAQHHLLLVGRQAVRMVRQIAAPHADRVHLRDVLRRGHERRHRTERFARIVHIQPRGDHPHAAVGQRPAHVDDPLVEELRFVDPHHVDVGGQQQDILSRFDRRRPDGVGIVRHHLLVGVARIDAGFENLHPQVGELGAAQAADQLLGLAREHRPADHLYPPLLTGIFQKHKSLNWFSSAVPPLKTSLCFSPGRSRLMFKYLHSLPSVPSL